MVTLAVWAIPLHHAVVGVVHAAVMAAQHGRSCACMYQPHQTEPYGLHIVCLYSHRLNVSVRGGKYEVRSLQIVAKRGESREL